MCALSSDKVGRCGDFFVDTAGHCFICLEAISAPPPEAEERKVYSFQYPSHYLKMDKTKVFNEKMATIPPHLLERVKRSRLKVELCGDCAKVNERFSVFYQQLERAEMEVGGCVRQFLERMIRAEELQLSKQFRVAAEANFKDVEKVNIVQRVRTEAFTKCNKKLDTFRPRVKIKRLSKKGQVPSSSEPTSSCSLQEDQPYHQQDEEEDDLGIRIESVTSIRPPSPPSKDSSVSLKTGLTNETDHLQSDSGKLSLESSTIRQHGEEDMDTSPTELVKCEDDDEDMLPYIEPEVQMEEGTGDGQLSSCLKLNPIPRGSTFPPTFSSLLEMLLESSPSSSDSSNTQTQSNLSMPPSSSTSSSELDAISPLANQFNYKITKTNGVKVRKAICNYCGKLFDSGANARRHILSIHLKHRFICNLCNKSFTQVHYLRTHQKLYHLGPYKCHKCNYTFDSTISLSTHQAICSYQLILPKSNPNQTITVTDSSIAADGAPKEHVHIDDDTQPQQIAEKEKEFEEREDTSEEDAEQDPLVDPLADPLSFDLAPALEEVGTIAEREHYDYEPSTSSTVTSNPSTNNTRKKIYYCDKCPAQYASSAGLSRHKKSYHLNKTYKCEICGTLKTQKYALTLHMRTAHGVINGSKSYTCEVCKKVYTDQSYFLNHVKTTHGVVIPSLDAIGILNGQSNVTTATGGNLIIDQQSVNENPISTTPPMDPTFILGDNE